jgi:hypothetical protein
MEKTIVGKRKSVFQSLCPFQGTSSGRREKTIFGKQKSPFPGCGLSKHQLRRYTQKNDFQQAKITFSNLGPF